MNDGCLKSVPVWLNPLTLRFQDPGFSPVDPNLTGKSSGRASPTIRLVTPQTTNMNLVSYSDSEGSDAEISKPTPAPAKPASKASAPKFVDRANPHKIRVNLPTTSDESKDAANEDAPPAKRARTGGAFSGFNAMLPAPKKTAQTANGPGSAGAPRRGLGVGVNLKTGATPAFSREPVNVAGNEDADQQGGFEDGASGHEQERGTATASAKESEEVKLIGKPTIFRPLSVVNKKQKKKKTAAEVAIANASASGSPSTITTTAGAKALVQVPTPAAPPKPKVSLFSLAQDDSPTVPAATMRAEAANGDEEADDEVKEGTTTYQTYDYQSPATINAPTNSSLNNIAADINLSAAERRQLFGRNASKNMPDAINVVNFNTDEEYAANERARASGELEALQAQSKGVRAIAPGKHSLKQLMNAATSQKDALEDSFAQGRRNKKEAGNKYGWS